MLRQLGSVFHLLFWCCSRLETCLFYPPCWEHLNAPRRIWIVRVVDPGGGGGGCGDLSGPSSLHASITAEETCLVQMFSLFASLHWRPFPISKATLRSFPIEACERNTHLLSHIHRRQFSLLCFSWSCENVLSHFALILCSHDHLEVKSWSAPQTQHNSPKERDLSVFTCPELVFGLVFTLKFLQLQTFDALVCPQRVNTPLFLVKAFSACQKTRLDCGLEGMGL